MRYIRWQGLLAFIIVSAALSFVWFLLVDSFIERTVEKTGTAIVGAKVELRDADLSLFPLGLTLEGLQVTNPDSPMSNAFEAQRISFLMDGMNLFRRKVIINEMSVEGVTLNTPRKSSGAVKKSEKRKASWGDNLLTFELPDIDEVIKKEDFESLRAARELRGEIDSDRDRYHKELKALVDENKIEGYKARIEKIKSGGKGIAGALGKANELMALHSEINAEAVRIRALVTETDKKLRTYRKRVDNALGAPQRDIERIKRKYAITPQGLTNVSRIFLEGTLIEWAETGLRWKNRLEPVVANYAKKDKGVEIKRPVRGGGVDVRFVERAPMPDFLVKKASVSVSIPAGYIKGIVTDITPDQDILGRPLRFHFSGEKLKGLDSMRLDGEVNRVNPSEARDTAEFGMKGYRLHELAFGSNSAFPVVLNKGITDLKLKAELSGGLIDARLSAALSSLEVSAGAKDEKNAVMLAVASVFPDIKKFNLDARLKGAVDDYRLELTTDLDDMLKASAMKVFAKEAALFEKKLKDEVLKKVGGEMDELKASYAGMEILEGELKKRLNLTNSFLSETKVGPGAMKLPFGF